MRAWCSCCCSLLLACVTLAVCNARPACSLLPRRAWLLALAEQASVQGQEGWQEESVSVQLRRRCLCSAGRQPMGAQLPGIAACRVCAPLVLPLTASLPCSLRCAVWTPSARRTGAFKRISAAWGQLGGTDSSATRSAGSSMRQLLLQQRVHACRHAATVIAEQFTSPNSDHTQQLGQFSRHVWGPGPTKCSSAVAAQPWQHCPQPLGLVSCVSTPCMLSPARQAPPLCCSAGMTSRPPACSTPATWARPW